MTTTPPEDVTAEQDPDAAAFAPVLTIVADGIVTHADGSVD